MYLPDGSIILSNFNTLKPDLFASWSNEFKENLDPKKDELFDEHYVDKKCLNTDNYISNEIKLLNNAMKNNIHF